MRESGVPSLPAGYVEMAGKASAPSHLSNFAVSTVRVRGITSGGICSPCLTHCFFSQICSLAGA